MNDLTLLKRFRAERAVEDVEARAEIRQRLQRRLDAAGAGAAPVSSSGRVRQAAARPRHLLRRRRALVFVGATVTVTALVGTQLLSAGPTSQQAAAATSAAILRETAKIALSSSVPTSSPLPGPKQLLYTKVKQADIEGWIAGCEPGTGQICGALGGTLNGPNAFNALVQTTRELWLGEDGVSRERRVLGPLRFWSQDERSRWESAGSPLPPPFDPEYQRRIAQIPREKPPAGESVRTREEDRGVFDVETAVDRDKLRAEAFRFPDTSSLPTDPKALRRAVEGNRISVSGFNLSYPAANRLGTKQTINQLVAILGEAAPMTPQLRAAIFNALAEMPGIEVETAATDSVGRRAYAIRSIEPQTEEELEFLFDPDTAELLAKRFSLGNASHRPYLKGVPAGATINETTYLETAVVDSPEETGTGTGLDENR
jgi:hypothetical protein